jgi:hypothetical protein
MIIQIQSITPAEYADIARNIFKKKNGYKNKTTTRLDNEICQSLIGTSYEICAELWNLINPVLSVSRNAQPKHLLWALLLMKQYSTEEVNVRLVGGADNKTYRKWSWLFIEAIANLKASVVSVLVYCASAHETEITLTNFLLILRLFGTIDSEVGMVRPSA